MAGCEERPRGPEQQDAQPPGPAVPELRQPALGRGQEQGCTGTVKWTYTGKSARSCWQGCCDSGAWTCPNGAGSGDNHEIQDGRHARTGWDLRPWQLDGVGPAVGERRLERRPLGGVRSGRRVGCAARRGRWRRERSRAGEFFLRLAGRSVRRGSPAGDPASPVVEHVVRLRAAAARGWRRKQHRWACGAARIERRLRVGRRSDVGTRALGSGHEFRTHWGDRSVARW
jgi:hypothetical protein